MDRDVYVVFGQTGSYDDAREWAVAAYFIEELAKEHARRANEWAAKMESKAKASDNKWKFYRESVASKSPFDAAIQMDSGGTEYVVASVPMPGALPTGDMPT